MTIAYYLRLSMADGDLGKDHKDESNSIENQRLLLEKFVASRDDLSGDVKEYIDDGYTGTNFNRPAFTQMIEDAKTGKIQMILVKDLSRLGRDYIGVGDYMEQIFPVLGIRFIAVNSFYDSADYEGKTMGLEMSISNLVNSLYSKDLSKKYKSAVQTKWKQGKSTAGRVPFGYKKCKEDKNRWDIDPEAAKIVRMIFEKAMSGWGTGQIANLLNEQQIPTPGAYREQHTDNYQAWNRIVSDDEWIWDTATVWRILKNYSYTGALVHGKTAAIRVGSKTRRSVPKNERYIVDGAHPAIISVDEYEEAQGAIRSNSTYSMPNKTNFSLNGKIRCGNCGLRMAYFERNGGKVTCRHKSIAGKYSKCDSTAYPPGQIESIVFYALRTKLALFENLKEIMEEEQERMLQRRPEQSRLKQTIETLKTKRIHQYEAYAEGLITKECYLVSKEELSVEIDRLQEQLDTANMALKEQNDLAEQVTDLAKRAEDIKYLKALTKEIVDEFIEAVVIYDPKHMEITFTFENVLQKAHEKVEQIQKQQQDEKEEAC
jgi:DNA invertase Pin-like site-specific DNA recombinase